MLIDFMVRYFCGYKLVLMCFVHKYLWFLILHYPQNLLMLNHFQQEFIIIILKYYELLFPSNDALKLVSLKILSSSHVSI